jgi:uncharacterized FlaG/YvyC family protein
MSEEEIAATGRFPTPNSTDFATSYQTPDSAPPKGASATSAVPTVNPSSVSVAPQSATRPSAADVDKAVAAANANLSSSNRTLDYRVDAVTGISIATIRNSTTGVVVQQIPGADIIALARLLAEWAPGKHMLLDLIA